MEENVKRTNEKNRRSKSSTPNLYMKLTMLKVKMSKITLYYQEKDKTPEKASPHIAFFNLEDQQQTELFLPIWRSHKRIGRRCHGSRSKVSKFHLSWFCQKDISCFDISGFREHRKLFLFPSLDCVEMIKIKKF